MHKSMKRYELTETSIKSNTLTFKSMLCNVIHKHSQHILFEQINVRTLDFSAKDDAISNNAAESK